MAGVPLGDCGKRNTGNPLDGKMSLIGSKQTRAVEAADDNDHFLVPCFGENTVGRR